MWFISTIKLCPARSRFPPVARGIAGAAAALTPSRMKLSDPLVSFEAEFFYQALFDAIV